ncbi:MAG: PD-(D/E)XK nuclease family protein, partial [Chloroflexota bacterium]
MEVSRDSFAPGCLICGSAPRCDQPYLEGAVVRVERHVMRANGDSVLVVRVHLHTEHGSAVLELSDRFAYLLDGLAETTGEVALRAYHLRRGRDHADAPSGRTASRFLSVAETLVVLEPDWLIDVTALKETNYCLRQWLANRLASRPSSLHQLRGIVVHHCVEVLCREGSLSKDAVHAQIARDPLGLALLGASPADLLDAVAPHLDRIRRWRAGDGAALLGGELGDPCFESTLLCPELGLRGRVDLALLQPRDGYAPSVRRVVELKTGKYNPQFPDPEFQVRGYYAMLAAHGRLAPDFKAMVIYTGSDLVLFQEVACGSRFIYDVMTRRNQVVLALLFGHAPPSRNEQACKKSGSKTACGRLSSLLGQGFCRGRDLADAAAGDGDPMDAAFYARHYRLLRL